MTGVLPAAVSEAKESEKTIKITDSSGNDFEIKSPPKKVISLYGALNDLLISLGAVDKIVARTKADENIKEIAHLPSIGTHMRPNPELVIAQKPDLVLQLKGRTEALANLDVLKGAGIPTVVFEIESFQDLFTVTRQLGEIMDKEQEARNLIEDWQRRLDRLEKKGPQKKPRVFYEARYPNLLAAGAKGIINDIIHTAGGINIVEQPKKLARVNEEFLFLKDPDAYIIQEGPMNPAPEPFNQRPGFENLKARERVLYVDERKFSRPGPYSIEAAEKLHEWLFTEH